MKNTIQTSWRRLVCLTSLMAGVLGCGGSLVAAPAEPTLHEQIAHATDMGVPLVWVGSGTGAEVADQALWQAFGQLRTAGVEAGAQAFEQFTAMFPESGWTPALRLKLAQYYRRGGRLSQSLAQCQAAWMATAGEKAPTAKALADEVLLLWGQTMGDLGQTAALDDLLGTVGDRAMANIHSQRKFILLRKNLDGMKSRLAGLNHFKCGVDAVAQMAFNTRLLIDPCEVLNVAASPDGFSLADLVRLGRRLRMELVAVQRLGGNELIVPSVFHWKLNHYSAIVGRTNGLYKVVDPILGGVRWLSADVINDEASGYFLVGPTAALPADWRRLEPQEAKGVWGKGGNEVAPLSSPPPCGVLGLSCPSCKLGGPSFIASNIGGCGGCGASGAMTSFWRGYEPIGGSPSPVFEESYVPQALLNTGPSGMPSWTVEEPYMSVWLVDEPMRYHPSRGRDVSLKLTYHEHESRPESSSIFSFGTGWNANILSYLLLDGYNVTAYAPGGGEWRYYGSEHVSPGPDYWSYSTVSTIGTSYQIAFPDGTALKYELLVPDGLGSTNAFLTQTADPAGYGLSFYYSTNNNVVLLTEFVDRNSQTNTVRYDDTLTTQVSEVENPFGQTVQFEYDEDGLLTNLTDVVGLSSSFTYSNYDSVPLLAKLTTPYGDTHFDYVEPDACLCFGGDTSAIHVVEPNGANHLYVYKDSSTFVPNSYDDAPEGVPVATSTTTALDGGLCNYNMMYRNSFYWGPNHYGLLSTTNVSELSSNDLRIARLRNWLHDQENGSFDLRVSGTINLEREASPDGVIEGQKTWYG